MFTHVLKKVNYKLQFVKHAVTKDSSLSSDRQVTNIDLQINSQKIGIWGVLYKGQSVAMVTNMMS